MSHAGWGGGGCTHEKYEEKGRGVCMYIRVFFQGTLRCVPSSLAALSSLAATRARGDGNRRGNLVFRAAVLGWGKADRRL